MIQQHLQYSNTMDDVYNNIDDYNLVFQFQRSQIKLFTLPNNENSQYKRVTKSCY